ncbi:MAG: hypothetical protein IME98_02650, partial [Proteobacteria bacterium]|nr:hypothetical protein [Pseudomonadota bacterium]
VITYYMALLLVPINQNIDYDFPISNSLFASPEHREGARLIYQIPAPVVSLIIIIVILALALYLLIRSGLFSFGGEEPGTGSRGRIASFFILWFFIALSPTSSFIPIIDVIFEHRLYLASIGFFVIAVLTLDWISSFIFTRSEVSAL